MLKSLHVDIRIRKAHNGYILNLVRTQSADEYDTQTCSPGDFSSFREYVFVNKHDLETSVRALLSEFRFEEIPIKQD